MSHKDITLEELRENARKAADFLKAIGHENRLMILCHLAEGEKSVTALETLLDVPQASVSQQLARLRADDMVVARRDGKAVYYSLSDNRAREVITLIYKLFCKP